MAAKLGSLTKDKELLASDRYYEKIPHKLVKLSCGCPNDKKVRLWNKVDLRDKGQFDFDSAYPLKSRWCPKHGSEYCEFILALDEEED